MEQAKIPEECLAGFDGIEPGESSSPLGYFACVQERFERAVIAAGGSLDLYYDLAGFSVRLRFAGDALVPMLAPALAHRQTSTHQTPLFTIGIWDSFSTGVPIPAPPWRRPEPALLGSLDYYRDRRLHMLFRHKNALSLLDREQNLAFYWCPDARQIRGPQTASPLQFLLRWWMIPQGYVLCHGAAVGTPTAAVLLGGKSGSGKSTTALACLSAGFLHVSDDLVLVGGLPTPRVFSLYNSAKLNADNLFRFPAWVARIANPDHLSTEKAIFFLQHWIPEQLAHELPLRAIVFPQFTGSVASQVRPVPAATSLTLLAPSSMRQSYGVGELTLQMLTELVRHVPSYVLELGTDLQQIPEVVGNVLAKSE